jgi:hypothetical protein
MEWGSVPLTVFIPLLGMTAVFLLNHALTHRRTSQQTGRDARGVRAALLAELILLRGLIADNLALVRQGEEYVLSFRVLTQVYRSNVGRLNLLAEMEIDAVVSAYGTTEAVEVFMGATTRPHGAHAYRIWLGDASWKDVGSRLQIALSVIGSGNRTSKTTHRRLSRPRPVRKPPRMFNRWRDRRPSLHPVIAARIRKGVKHDQKAPPMPSARRDYRVFAWRVLAEGDAGGLCANRIGARGKWQGSR